MARELIKFRSTQQKVKVLYDRTGERDAVLEALNEDEARAYDEYLTQEAEALFEEGVAPAGPNEYSIGHTGEWGADNDQ